nr:DNA repair protein RecN [Eubacterium sp.]
LKKEIESEDLSEGELSRELDRLNYIKDEIEKASLNREEMDEIDKKYSLAANSGKLVESLSHVYSDGSKQAADAIGRVVADIKKAAELDENIAGYADQLIEIESLLGDFNRDISSFMQDYTFDEAELVELERRMDTIHSLQSKYGESYDDIMAFLSETDEKIAKYEDYESFSAKRREKFEELEQRLKSVSEKLSVARKEAADTLNVQICEALSDLNFANADFAIDIRPLESFTSRGLDEVEFLISTNPGEPKKSLSKVASGGELSRIMLAIKSVFAESDDIETLIFDEIDTGISGRTAQMVSEKMATLGKSHQIICITHLAQIAAMADRHFVIEKDVNDIRSTTSIRPLDENESVEELARILGGAEITEATRKNAREMKQMANELKS